MEAVLDIQRMREEKFDGEEQEAIVEEGTRKSEA